MSKNIVLCADGTSNRGGMGQVTNVWRLYRALDLNQAQTDSGQTQIAIHDDGVGTENFKWLKLISGATGLGLRRNIRQLYMFLCRNYESGDRIYLFGFSRGAYTVRALAGLIAKCGIVDKRLCKSEVDFKNLAKKAMGIYRGNYRPKKLAASRTAAQQFIQEHGIQDEANAPGGQVQIQFVGVWDTVDAYGLPWDGLTDALDYIYPFKFRDRTLSPQVLKGAHAIAIDDQRDTFHPVMWDEKEDHGDHVHQVWFSGMHSNVGGGYPKDGMAMVTLDWMMAEAEKAGLSFLSHRREEVCNNANALAKMYDSRSGLGIYYRYKPRNIDVICQENHIAQPKIHQSVFQRLQAGVAGYAPGNLPATMSLVETHHPNPHPKVAHWQQHANQLEGTHALLKAKKWTIFLRSFLHYLLAIISLVLAGYLAWDLKDLIAGQELNQGEDELRFNSTLSIVKWAIDYLIHNPIPYMLFAGVVLVFCLGHFAKRNMQAAFGDYWFKNRPN